MHPFHSIRHPSEELRTILYQSGTPAESAISPSRKGTFYEALTQLAQWAGMAVPGRGGLGPMGRSVPPPMRTGLRKPHETEQLGKIVDQAFREWMRENVVGKSLPKTTSSEGFPVTTSSAGGGTKAYGNEQELYENVLWGLFASLIGRKAPGQQAFVSPGSAEATRRVTPVAGPRGNMPLLRSSPATHPVFSEVNPLFWLVE